jgi:hypothetical protein
LEYEQTPLSSRQTEAELDAGDEDECNDQCEQHRRKVKAARRLLPQTHEAHIYLTFRLPIRMYAAKTVLSGVAEPLQDISR